MKFLFPLLFFLPTLLPAQENIPKNLLYIQKLVALRNEVLQKDEVELKAFGELMSRWENEDPETISRFINDIYGFRILHPFSFKKVYIRLNNKYPGTQYAKELKEEDLETISQNQDVLDLVYMEIIEPKYPFRLTSNKQLFQEINFYELQNEQYIGEVGAGNGMFSIVLAMLENDLDITINELSGKVWRIKNNIELHQHHFNPENLHPIKGSKKDTEFAPNSMDKIIIRNSFHHFSKMQEMLLSIKTALKKDGELYVLEYTKDHWQGGYQGCPKINTDAYNQSIMEANGFKMVASTKMEYEGKGRGETEGTYAGILVRYVLVDAETKVENSSKL